ncbi:MAG: hypothetical protein ACRCZI_02660 [Cetobacterium sp.]
MSKRDQNKDLLLEDGTQLKWFNRSNECYLNKTTLIYGQTNSGKSTIIDEIMYLCKDYIVGIFVICQSTVIPTSSPYYKKVPINCIKNSVTKEWLEKMMEIQKGRAAIYDTANDLGTLKKVCSRLSNNDIIRNESIINLETNRCTERIRNNNKIDFAEKKAQITHVESIRDSNLINVYKNAIRKYNVDLESINGLSPEERCCIKFIDFNPNIMIVYDDCASMFKKWVKSSPIIKEMFYNGRHYYITQVIGLQDDKEADSELRKNARVSIFTTAQAATANFTRTSNSYSKSEKTRAAHCIKKIFTSDIHSVVKNYKKLVYQQQNNDPFNYMIADVYDHFQMGSESLWKIDEMISEKSGKVGIENAFFSKYTS